MASPVLERVNVTPDAGVVKEIYQRGEEGVMPSAGDEITAHYTGTLEDGSKFDSSRDRGTPFKFVLAQGRVIKAWDLGFATMCKGEKAVLICQSDYAYGDQGSPPKIPAKATLRFDVELLSFKPKTKEVWEMAPIERVTSAKAAKDRGNEAFKAKNLPAALEQYEEAERFVRGLTSKEGDAALATEITAVKLSIALNKSLVQSQLENWEDARNSAAEAKAVDPTSTKAMFRFGVACTHLGMYDEAKADLRRAIELEPKDKALRAAYKDAVDAEAASAAKARSMFGGLFGKV